MAYEIPQKLQYDEKIIFGLTFRQLAYAFAFLLPALIIFLRLKAGLYLKLGLSTILIILAFLFMFFDFMQYIKNIAYWCKIREMSMMDRNMLNFLGIVKIDKGVLHVKGNKKDISGK